MGKGVRYGTPFPGEDGLLSGPTPCVQSWMYFLSL
jgi:hypothetical protein